MNFPYHKTSEKWSYTCFYDFWLFGYSRVRLQKTAILDLLKMADIEGVQLDSIKKLVADGHI